MILITGGCGFLGSNLAKHLSKTHEVTVLDNFSRVGSQRNADWLGLPVIRADIRDLPELPRVDAIFHLAGQVTVTESLKYPLTDFDENARGTLNILEYARINGTPVIFTSTNKVYGEVPKMPIPETHPLNPKSPYGCSKACAEQYCRDYYSTYGLPTVVLRQSCIYGPRQFGMEGQGWISWFVNRNVSDEELTIFGDGEQVRDILYVDDWVRAVELVYNQMAFTQGEVYNIGGGPENTISLNEAVKIIGNTKVSYGEPRVADQPTYISDITKISNLGWEPSVGATEGIEKLIQWQSQL